MDLFSNKTRSYCDAFLLVTAAEERALILKVGVIRWFKENPMAQVVEDWYKQMPVITRSYLTAAILTTVGCSLDIISPYHLYLHPTRVVKQYEFWRLITNFFFFGKMDLDFLFHMFFLARYCKLLEENSFRGRTADFFYMLFFGGSVLTAIVLAGGMIPYLSQSFAKLLFLSNSLTFMMVYVWSKRNPFVHMSFLGLFTFTAPYLPWDCIDATNDSSSGRLVLFLV
eukprot:Gb_10513 [translate_table: standard]